MGKIKELFRGPHRWFAWYLVGTTAIFIYSWTLGKGNTVFHWINASVEERRQEKLMEFYRNENAEIDRRLDILRTDRDTLEKFAREQFHFAIPGEDVFIVDID